MKHINKLIFTCLLFGVFSVHANIFAQSRISGKVVDDTGTPLPGASVVLKGTLIGTVTDGGGNYSITVPDGNAVLEFSFVGYLTQEIVAGNQTIINVEMMEDAGQLEEVVVIGYGSVRKRDLTGSVGTLRTQDVGNVAVANVENMIQGRIAGVNVTNENGLPGAGTSINIRGVGTLNNSEPLYIVDGMPGSINSVSQYDIESIDILKDASATAIYGARAANGVVLITTKRGQRGQPRVSVNSYWGISQVAKKIDLLNASEYIDLCLDITETYFTSAARFRPKPEGLGMTEAWARTDRVKIQDEIFRNAAQQEYNINIRGGAENSVYSVSGTYTDMDAITHGYNYGRFILTANTEFTIRKFVKIGQNLSVRRTNTTGRSVNYTGALRWAPYMELIEPANSWGYSKTTSNLDLNDTFNPLPDLFLGKRKDKSTSIRENVYVEVSLLDMFKWRTQLQYTNNSNNNFNWMPYTENGQLNNQPSISDSFGYSEGAMVENYLTFNKIIGIHSFNAMVGNTYSSSKLNNGRSASVSGQGTTNDPWENYEVLLVTRTPAQSLSNGNSYSAYLSYYGRLNYSLMDKYLFTFTYRQDASMRFSPKNRWGKFPSLAFAWKMDEENFMKQISGISQAKLRLSWGQSGNDRINDYAFLANLYQGSNQGVRAAFGENISPLYGTTIREMPAVNIRWETTTSYNAGLDLGFLNNKLTASLDVYTRLTDGILIRVPINYSSGIDSSPLANAAEVRNTGFEFVAGYNLSLGEVKLRLSGVLSYVKNEVVSLGAGEPLTDGNRRSEVGHSIYEFYGRKVDRVLSTTADANAYKQKFGIPLDGVPVAGDLAFQDIAGPLDKDGKPTPPDNRIDNSDRTFIGKSIPPWNFGMNITANYRRFDFLATGSGITGSSIYDDTRVFELEGMQRQFNQTRTVLRRWRKEGDITDVPRAVSGDPASNRIASDRYIKSGNYFRIKTVTLGYTVPLNPNNRFADNLRFYITAQNLLTFTKYDGYDPEVRSTGVMSSGNMTPIPRTFIFGLQMTL